MRLDSDEAPVNTNQLILARRDAFVAARDIYLTVVLAKSDIKKGTGGGLYDPERPIFIQYLNPEVLACYGLEINGGHRQVTLQNALWATRLALLATDRYLIFPSSYIFEVRWFSDFLAEIESLIANGHVRYTSPVSDLGEYRDIKIFEYRRDSLNPYMGLDFRQINLHGDLIWTPRPGRPTAVDIGDRWRSALFPGGALHALVQGIAERRHRRYTRIEHALEKIPERLDGQAFIKRFVEAALPARITPANSNSLAFFLSSAYLESYVTDLNAMMLVDFPIGDLSCGVQNRYPDMRHRLVSARVFDTALRWLRLHDYVHRAASWDELAELRSSVEFRIVASAIGNGFTLALTFAILAARKTRHFKIAESYPQAAGNLAMVAEAIAALVEQPKGFGGET